MGIVKSSITSKEDKMETNALSLYRLLKSVSPQDLDKIMLVRTTIEHECTDDDLLCFCASHGSVHSASDIFSIRTLLEQLGSEYLELSSKVSLLDDRFAADPAIKDVCNLITSSLLIDRYDDDTTYDISLLTNSVSSSDSFYAASYNRFSFDKQTLIDELIHMTKYMYKHIDKRTNDVVCEVIFKNPERETSYPYKEGFYKAVYNKESKTLSIRSDLDFKLNMNFHYEHTYLTLNESEINELLPSNIREFLTDDTTLLNPRLQVLVSGACAIDEVSQDILKFHKCFLSSRYLRYPVCAEIEFFDLSNTIESSLNLFENIAHFYKGEQYDSDAEYDYDLFDNSGVYIVADDLID